MIFEVSVECEFLLLPFEPEPWIRGSRSRCSCLNAKSDLI